MSTRPEINEPEAHLKVRDLVAEDLALQPGPLWRRSSIDSWMERHRMDHLADSWLDAIDPLDRLALLTHLALEDHRVELAVFDSPDRHGIPEESWIDYLQTVAAGRRSPAVVAVVTRIPLWWEGAGTYAGAVQRHDAFEPPATPGTAETTAEAAATDSVPPVEDAPAAPEPSVFSTASKETR